ncbi:MAG: flagellar export chaperone FliS [Ruminiclostridium sp.]|nr:flagellar export chaperone FliS [Ruminiclostridium sp.]
MALNKAYNQYKENSIYTAAPEELTLMLYNGLVKFIMLARTGIDESDLEKANNNIIRAQDIILHFQATLDMRYEVSQNLDMIYDFMYRHLLEANMKKDKAMLDDVLGLVKEIRDTWQQAMKLAKHTQSKPQQIAR